MRRPVYSTLIDDSRNNDTISRIFSMNRIRKSLVPTLLITLALEITTLGISYRLLYINAEPQIKRVSNSYSQYEVRFNYPPFGNDCYSVNILQGTFPEVVGGKDLAGKTLRDIQVGYKFGFDGMQRTLDSTSLEYVTNDWKNFGMNIYEILYKLNNGKTKFERSEPMTLFGKIRKCGEK